MIAFILMKCGLSRIEAIHRVPASFGNQLLACYWMDQGREIEGITDAVKRTSKAREEFEKMANRKHNFNFE